MTDTTDRELFDTARAWLAEDPDPATRAELADLLERAQAGDAGGLADLAESFDGTLQFGTAGLRGKLGPGSNRMNRIVVSRAAAGLAAYLVRGAGDEPERRGGRKSVVIGYDARRNSDVFARDTAQIMSGAGLSALVFPRALPTPLLAFAIRELGCSAGVMVTASHNPPEDNGYKVYLGDGSQIVQPADLEIAAQIAAVGPISEIPRSDDYRIVDDAVTEAYIARAASLLDDGPREISVVYTPMHGVGGELFVRVLEAAGFPLPATVSAQFEPDGRFPTVCFPNPEEPGAMDLSLGEARARSADVIIANDPDADRCAVGIRSGDDYRMLTGDEVGALLGWWIVQRDHGMTRNDVYAQSIVSATLLERIASAAGLGYAATLTGFKWISRVPGLRYGYEEALGYCVDPAAVRDKDGITAALLVLEMAATLKAQGRDLQDVLDDLAARYGHYATSQLSVRVADIAVIADAMRRLRMNPPTELAGRTVLRFEDLSAGGGASPTSGADNGGTLPPTDALRFVLQDARVIVRPSGTEPKLKCYLQVVVPGGPGARVAAETELDRLRGSIAAALDLET
jgi:phosphomannomutase